MYQNKQFPASSSYVVRTFNPFYRQADWLVSTSGSFAAGNSGTYAYCAN